MGSSPYSPSPQHGAKVALVRERQLRVVVGVVCVVVATAVAFVGVVTATTRQAARAVSAEPVSVRGERAEPRWEAAPTWALHPEILPGSRRFDELSRKGSPDPGEPTNVVLITTDDMNANELRWMPKTRALLGEAGVSFSDSVSPHPLCCPARAMTLTGQFAQNNGVRTNKWPAGGYYGLDHSNTLPVWLQRAGYQTGFVGKYLNEYGKRRPDEVPPGWDHWRAVAKGRGVYDYNNFQATENGRLRDHPATYATDYYTGQSERLIQRMSARDKPFFLWQSHLAPHTSCPLTNTDKRCWRDPMPSRRYARAFDHVDPPQLSKPSYNERDVHDKPARVSRRASLTASDRRDFTELFQRRIESLQSVDDAVARTVGALDAAGELDNTLVLFTSDNGFLLGEHRISGKNVGYEPALRVPLLMRGPTVPAGVRRDATVGTVDLAPTIAAAAGADPGLRVDGRNLLPVASGQRRGWETILIQGGPNGRNAAGGWLFRGVRTQRYTYIEHRNSGDVELYDRQRDPYQLHSLAEMPTYASVQAELRHRLQALRDCAGAQCRQTFDRLP